jgi:4-amino-4-deoxy-L-arabinose transferase-like glycosyltransferase
MSERRTHYLPIALLAVCFGLGVAYRIWLCTQPLHFGGDGELRYNPIAKNLLAGNGFSTDKSPPYSPDIKQVPLYPFFLALIYWLTDYSTTAVLVAQAFVEILVIFLMTKWMKKLNLPASTMWIVVGAWLIVPVFTINVRVCYTETLVTFLFTLACYCLTCLSKASPIPRLCYACAFGTCAGLASLTRAEMPICLAIIAAYAVLTLPSASIISRLGLTALAITCCLAVMAPWLIRDYSLTGRVGLPGHRQLDPYVITDGDSQYRRWINTWWDDPIWVTPYGFQALGDGPSTFPRSHMRDAAEAEDAAYALKLARQQGGMDGEPGEIFRRLADRANDAHPLWVKFLLPIRRVAMTWVRSPSTIVYPKEFTFPLKAVCYCGWLIVLFAAGYGTFEIIRRSNRALLLLLVAIGTRCLMPFTNATAMEPRYMAPALPCLFILSGVGAWYLGILLFTSANKQTIGS